MNTLLKIVQLSDCHISKNADAVYRGINPRETLASLLPAVREYGPDVLLVTGDLAEDGSDEVYGYLSELLAGFNVPILTIPGNHDRPLIQRGHFHQTPVDRPWVFDTAGWRLILLNSAIEKKITGGLSDRELRELDKHLSSNTKPTLVVLHHQPVMVNAPWIDRFPLLEPERFWSVVDAHSQVRAVLWGHVHHDFTGTRNGMQLLGSPSTAANSLSGVDKFTHDPAGPAFRWLNLVEDGRVETGVSFPAARATG